MKKSLLFTLGLISVAFSTHAGDRAYIVNPAVPNDITFVERKGNVYYVSPPNPSSVGFGERGSRRSETPALDALLGR